MIQLGEAPERVFVSGAPALDNLKSFEPMSRLEMEEKIGLAPEASPILVTFHSTTLEAEETQSDTEALLGALENADTQIVITAPNADPASAQIRASLQAFAANRTGRAVFVENLGLRAYYTLLGKASVMVGNSSSGIIEAASFGLPVVNIGNRQKGRLCGENVIHVPAAENEISDAIARATSPQFKASVAGMVNPYGDGHAAQIIADTLAGLPTGAGACMKLFYDLEIAQ